MKTRLVDYFAVVGFDFGKAINRASVGKILQRFPQCDWPDNPFFQGLELFCQPLGWRLSLNCQKPSYFVSVLTDIANNRHYCACFTFWEPVSLSKSSSGASRLNAPIDDQEFSDDELFSPICLVVVSKHDYFETFQNCLGTVYSVFKKKLDFELETLVGNLIGHVYVPPPGSSRITFSLGASDNHILQPPLHSSIPTTQTRVSTILHLLGIHNTVLLFCAALTEKKILFLSRSFRRLADACLALVALIYPLKFNLVYIPVLPNALLEILNSPAPFIMGVHSSLKSQLSYDVLKETLRVDLEVGSVSVPEGISVPVLPETFMSKLVTWLTLCVNSEVFWIDDAFPTRFSADDGHKTTTNGFSNDAKELNLNSNLNLPCAFPPSAAAGSAEILQPPMVATGLLLLDKKIRACFLRILVDLLLQYQEALQFVRINPKPFITFHKSAFLGLRNFEDNGFICRLLDSMAFQIFVAERGKPFRSCDLFDDLVASGVDDDPDDYSKSLDSISSLARELQLNEAPAAYSFPQLLLQPRQPVLEQAFPELDPNKIQAIIDEGTLKFMNSTSKLGEELLNESEMRDVPEYRDFDTLRRPCQEHFRRLTVLNTCLRLIFENKILEAKKSISAVMHSMKNRYVRVAFCQSLSSRRKQGGASKTTLEPGQFDLIVRLMNSALQNDTQLDEYGVAYSLLSLADMYCRRLLTGVDQFAYTCVQDHAVWSNQQFWEAAFFHDVSAEIARNYLQSNAECTSIASNTSSCEKSGAPDLWNLSRDYSARAVASEQIKASVKRDPSQLAELSAQEEAIVYSQALHYSNRIMFFRVPLDLSKVRTGHYNTDDNGDSSANNDDGSSTAESGYIEGDPPATAVADFIGRFISKFLDRVCTEAGVTKAHIALLHEMIPSAVTMHIESLQVVHRESMKLPDIIKPRIHNPHFLAGEKMISGYLRGYLLSDGRDSGCPDDRFILPAEGTLFLTNYRIIFKGHPCEPNYAEKTLLRTIPLMAVINCKKIGPQPLPNVQVNEVLREALQIRSSTFELIRVAFTDDIKSERIDGFCQSLRLLRWPESVSPRMFAFSASALIPVSSVEADLSKSKEKYLTLGKFAKKTFMKTAQKAGFAPSSKSAGLQFHGFGANSNATLSHTRRHTPSESSNATLPSKMLSPTSESSGSDRSTPSRSHEEDLDVVSELPSSSGGPHGVVPRISRESRVLERPYCRDYERMGLCAVNEPNRGCVHSGAESFSHLTNSEVRLPPPVPPPPNRFRLSHVNKAYAVCRSLPAVLVVPSKISDESLSKLARGHRMNRFVVVTWQSPKGVFLCRGAGFLSGNVVSRLKKKTFAEKTAEDQAVNLKSRVEQERYFAALSLLASSVQQSCIKTSHGQHHRNNNATTHSRHNSGSANPLHDSAESLVSLDSLFLNNSSAESQSLFGSGTASSVDALSATNQSSGSPSHRNSIIAEQQRTFNGSVRSPNLGIKDHLPKLNTLRMSERIKGGSLRMPSLLSPQLSTASASNLSNAGTSAASLSGSRQRLNFIEDQCKKPLLVFGEKAQLKHLRYDSSDAFGFIPIEFTETGKMKASFKKLLKTMVPSSTTRQTSFLKSLEASEWLNQVHLLLKTANAIVDVMLLQHSSVAVCLEDGSDFTAQVVSLAELMLDPYYRTLEGFCCLIEKEWLSFGHRFSYRNNHTALSQSSGVAPVFLQFLDCVHQLLLKFPETFEFNDFYLQYLAYHSMAAYFQTFTLDCELERLEFGILNNDLSMFSFSNVARPRQPLTSPEHSAKAKMHSTSPPKSSVLNQAQNPNRSTTVSIGSTSNASAVHIPSVFEDILLRNSVSPLFYNFLYWPPSISPSDIYTKVIMPDITIAALDVWSFYFDGPLSTASVYDLDTASVELLERQTDKAATASENQNSPQQLLKHIDSEYDPVGLLQPNAFLHYIKSALSPDNVSGSIVTAESLHNLGFRWEETLVKVRQALKVAQYEAEQVDATYDWARWLHRILHKRSTVELLLRSKNISLSVGQPPRDEERNAHCFIKHNYTMPMPCDYCSGVIWGLAAQGLRCAACGYNCHEKCASSAPETCIRRNSGPFFPKGGAVESTTEIKHRLQPETLAATTKSTEKTGEQDSGTATPQHIFLQGYLSKQGALLKGWHPRWFVLDSMKHQLRYHDTKDDFECRRIVDLAEVVAVELISSGTASTNKSEEAFFEGKCAVCQHLKSVVLNCWKSTPKQFLPKYKASLGLA